MTTPKKLLPSILGFGLELAGAFLVLLVPAAFFALRFQDYCASTPVLLLGLLGLGLTAASHILQMRALNTASSPSLTQKSPGFANVLIAFIGAMLFVAGALVGHFLIWIAGVIFLVVGSWFVTVRRCSSHPNTVPSPLDRALWPDSAIFGLRLLGLASLLASPVLLAIAPNQWRLPALAAAAAAAAWMLSSILKKQPKT
jgi:hypothetical protein